MHDLMTAALREITGEPAIRMCWTKHQFYRTITMPYGIELVGMPASAGRRIPGSTDNTRDELLRMWESGRLYFERRVPGNSIAQTRQRTRSDVKSAHKFTATDLPRRQKRRKQRVPKSIQFIENSDIELEAAETGNVNKIQGTGEEPEKDGEKMVRKRRKRVFKSVEIIENSDCE